MGRNGKRLLHRCRGLNQDMQGHHHAARCGVHRLHSLVHIVHRLDLGHHEVAQASRCAAHDDGHVGLEIGMVYRVHPRTDAGAGQCSLGICQGVKAGQQLAHGVRLFDLAARRGAVFAVQGDVHHTGAKLLQQLSLQDQALLHARGRAAVVVTHRQHPSARLGT